MNDLEKAIIEKARKKANKKYGFHCNHGLAIDSVSNHEA